MQETTGDHEAWIFEAVNLALTQSKEMRPTKTIMNTTVSISERENHVKYKCREPYGQLRNIIVGGMIRFSTTNGDHSSTFPLV